MHDPVRQNFSHRWFWALLGALGFPWLFWGLPAGAQTLGKDITQGLRDGAFDLEFRYRYEFVDEAAFDGRRVVHLGVTEHPLDVEPSNMGHSIATVRLSRQGREYLLST